MIDLDQIIRSLDDKIESSADEKVYGYALTIQSRLNGAEADDAMMAGDPTTAFACKTAKVSVAKKQKYQYSISLSYNNENSPDSLIEDISDKMSFHFHNSKQYAFG